MKLNFTQIKETGIYVKDLERTRHFYQDQLGLELIVLTKGRHVFFRAGTSVLLCFIAEATQQDTQLPPHYGTGNIHFAFETERNQYEAWKKKITTEGIAIEQETTWRDGLKSFYFRDPDGHLVEIVEPGIWE